MLSLLLTIYLGKPPLVNCVTVTPLSCEAAVVELAPRVQPVNVLVLIPVYVISSLSINTVPELSKPVALVKSISVSDASIASAAVVELISSSCVI